MAVVRNPWSCLAELDFNVKVHSHMHGHGKRSGHAFRHGLKISHSLAHTHTHEHRFYDSVSRESVAHFPHETHEDFHKISDSNRDDRKDCSWPSYFFLT